MHTRIFQIKQNISQYQNEFFKQNVNLVAVSKTRDVTEIYSAYQTGIHQFGENYLQEAVQKIDWFESNHPDAAIEWHFIGPIQSNKTKTIASYFDWVQSIDRLKIALRLAEQRPVSKGAINILLQCNISQEKSKSGCLPEEALELARELIQIDRLSLRGMMCIPAADDGEAFENMRQIFQNIKSNLPLGDQNQFDTLSMGMSQDYLLAIQYGSTMVRIGTAIFGERTTLISK